MSASIFDSHAHYDDEAFCDDANTVISSLPHAGVGHVINVGCDLESCESTIALTKQYDFMYGAVGIHPHSAQQVLDSDYLERLSTFAQNKKIVAIGEIGLDYHYDFSPRQAQKQVFTEQMELAKKLDLPVIIHSREATADTLEILSAFEGMQGVVHCFSGSDQTAKTLIDMGYYIGFTGSITFKNNHKGPAAAAVTPLDRLLIETDCPYMAPVPLRGKRCDSTMLPLVAQKLAQIKGVTPEQIIQQTRENTCTLFRISL